VKKKHLQTLKVPIHLQKRALREEGYAMYKRYCDIAVLELAKALVPRIVPTTSDSAHVFAFSVEIDLPKEFVRGEFK